VVADGDFLADEEAAGDVTATRRNVEVLRRSAIPTLAKMFFDHRACVLVLS
jgi:hypothetical protein